MKPLTRKQRAAVDLIRATGITYVDDPNVYAPVTTAETCAIPEAWVNWQTAAALERRGLGRVEYDGESDGAEFILYPASS